MRRFVWAIVGAIVYGGVANCQQPSPKPPSKKTETTKTQNAERGYRVKTGDMLGVYITGVLGTREDGPPVLLRDGRAFTGFPRLVRGDGTIAMPMIPPLRVEGLSLPELKERLRKAYIVDQKILDPDGRNEIVVTKYLENTGLNSYPVKPGDVLGFTVLSESPSVTYAEKGGSLPAIGNPVTVAHNGTIRLPYIERIMVGGMTLMEIQNAVNMKMVDAEIIGKNHFVDITLMWKATPERLAYKIQPGDVLALRIEGVTSDELLLEKSKIWIPNDVLCGPSIGFPVVVRSNGKIKIPYVGELAVAENTLEEAVEILKKAYTVDRQVLQPGRDSVELSILRRGSRIEIDHKLRVGDVLCIHGIRVSNAMSPADKAMAPCIGTLVVVLDDGRISLPFVEGIAVEGKTVHEVQDEIVRVLTTAGLEAINESIHVRLYQRAPQVRQ